MTGADPGVPGSFARQRLRLPVAVARPPRRGTFGRGLGLLRTSHYAAGYPRSDILMAPRAAPSAASFPDRPEWSDTQESHVAASWSETLLGVGEDGGNAAHVVLRLRFLKSLQGGCGIRMDDRRLLPLVPLVFQGVMNLHQGTSAGWSHSQVLSRTTPLRNDCCRSRRALGRVNRALPRHRHQRLLA